MQIRNSKKVTGLCETWHKIPNSSYTDWHPNASHSVCSRFNLLSCHWQGSVLITWSKSGASNDNRWSNRAAGIINLFPRDGGSDSEMWQKTLLVTIDLFHRGHLDMSQKEKHRLWIDEGWIPFSCFSFRGPGAVHAETPSHCHIAGLYWDMRTKCSHSLHQCFIYYDESKCLLWKCLTHGWDTGCLHCK